MIVKFLNSLLILSFGFLVSFQTEAASKQFGLGAVIGDPTGFTGKYLLERTTAIEATLSFFGDRSFHLHGSYLKIKPNAIAIDGEDIGFYFGIGGRIITFRDGYGPYKGFFAANYTGTSRTTFAVRAPIGLNYHFRDPSIEVFGEIALAMDFVPFTDADFDVGIGARYYF